MVDNAELFAKWFYVLFSFFFLMYARAKICASQVELGVGKEPTC